MEELIKQLIVQMNNRFDGVDKEIGSIKTEVGEVKAEQVKMREEIAFYYGSMMREIENSRTEARSQFKHLAAVVDREREVIELLSKKIDL
ncbi:hypothetical protein CVD25_16645 [Bacillus canaveralius]|uniref:Uncharacterized protein n=1 Tax=Bacillus canaveralius TaxID=1403243 RepID=A0A2N5GMM4_9BACI|nr:hypothetical protein [Bacillus canaveralius]PLR83152.1 hypothetical protein CU635_09720 [Bacillus canaveralius]PLR94070.1 hypothetical protein CVD25_16645 [Bacillus canaveralius]RSK54129.1 hypothetical protein EJA13_06010 [Bacillus canaveralius]